MKIMKVPDIMIHQNTIIIHHHCGGGTFALALEESTNAFGELLGTVPDRPWTGKLGLHQAPLDLACRGALLLGQKTIR